MNKKEQLNRAQLSMELSEEISITVCILGNLSYVLRANIDKEWLVEDALKHLEKARTLKMEMENRYVSVLR